MINIGFNLLPHQTDRKKHCGSAWIQRRIMRKSTKAAGALYFVDWSILMIKQFRFISIKKTMCQNVTKMRPTRPCLQSYLQWFSEAANYFTITTGENYFWYNVKVRDEEHRKLRSRYNFYPLYFFLSSLRSGNEKVADNNRVYRVQ